ncbi:MAG: hypothetical protein AAB853_05615, partial [Patescibacteria group bacterium]
WSIKDGWESHYNKMRGGLRQFLLNTAARRNFAIIGPGFEPIGYDFEEEDVPILNTMETIILVDISQEVVKNARGAFIHAGVKPHKIHAIQYDITNGLSTVCHHFIEGELRGICTEEELSRHTEQFETLEIGELDSRLINEIEKVQNQRREYLLEGGLNKSRTWKLTCSGEPLPLDIVSYQMVLAGTLAHSMQAFRDRFVDVTSRETRIGKATEHARLEMFQRMHRLLSRFSTTIAVRSIRKILEDNNDVKILALTDVSTVYEDPPFGALTELSLDDLSRELSHPPAELQSEGVPTIVTRVPRSWKWLDEPEHGHSVIHAEFERKCFPDTEDDSEGANAQSSGLPNVTSSPATLAT